MINTILDINKLKVLWFFVVSPGKHFRRKDFSNFTKIPNTILNTTLNSFVNNKLFKKKNKYFALNFESNIEKVIELLKVDYANLRHLPLNICFILFDLIDYLSKNKEIDVYLFGSYSKLIFNKNSDIDIAIVSDNNVEYEKFIQKLEKKYGIEIEIHKFDKDFYKNKSDPLVSDILKDGIKLI